MLLRQGLPGLSLLVGVVVASACSSEATPSESAPGSAGTSGVSGAAGSTQGGSGASGGAGGSSSQGGATGEGGASQGGASTGGAAGAGTAGSGGAPLPTCKQAGGDRCGATQGACAGLFTLASSDCVSCCKVPSNPVFDAGWADPYMVRVGGTYYTFSTGATVRRRSSEDLVKWSAVDDAIGSAPWKKADSGFWAPAVYRAKSGKWILYYASERKGATTQHCIGRAVANSIAGTFVDNDTEPFLCHPTHWSIDPSVFRNNGNDYLLWRQDTTDMPSGNAYIRPLDDNGNLAGVEHKLLSRAKTEPSWEFDANGGVLENPAMIHEDGVFHLFYSGYRWQTAKYANGHALCDAVFGPCTKTSKESPWLGSKGDMIGPGGADFVKAADGTLFIYMHGWHPNLEGARKLWMYRLKVNGNAVSIAPM